MPLSVVVLPAPLAPIRQTSSRVFDVQVDALDGADAAVGDRELVDGEERAASAMPLRRPFRLSATSPPRYAAMTAGSFCTSAAGPSAIFLP